MEAWQRELADSLRTGEDLVREGLIAREASIQYDRVLKEFKFFLPRYYAGLIDRADPRCPIRLQAIPSPEESRETPGLRADPLGDLDHRPAPRLTHRYRNRALLHATPNCSMYCRYCFRKSLLNELRGELFAGDWEEAFAYLADHGEIEEVILSGGDPLLLGDRALLGLLRRLREIPHLRRLRLHTRVPVTLPSRVTPSLAEGLAAFPLVVVAHFNHPRELTPEARQAARRLRAHVPWLLNQSVLLRGVNDSTEVLADLSRGLFEAGILPYYLHHPDRARGTAHFDLSRREGVAIHRRLKESLPGYLVPRYVVDTGDGQYKRDVAETL